MIVTVPQKAKASEVVIDATNLGTKAHGKYNSPKHDDSHGKQGRLGEINRCRRSEERIPEVGHWASLAILAGSDNTG
jgi:hypothetical protein